MPKTLSLKQTATKWSGSWMSQTELEIFRLCEKLVELLGDSEAVANLKTLQERHPEMFENKEAVKRLIERVVAEPEIIIKNPKAKNDKDFMAYSQINETKMGDVGIRNDDGVNEIFHANYKNIRRLEVIRKQMSVEASSAKAAPTRSDHYADEPDSSPRCDKALSTSATATIPQIQSSNDQANELKEKVKAFAESLKPKANNNEMER